MELRDEWKKLEKRIPVQGAANEDLRELTAESVGKLEGELAKFRARLVDGRREHSLATFMTTNVATCAETDSVAQAVGTMWDRDVGCLPVVDAGKQVIGMITDRDAAVAAWSRGKRLDDMTVGSVMSRAVHTCTPGDDARAALTAMSTHQLRRLPIVGEAGHLVGIVTLADLTRGLGSDQATTSTGPRQVVDTLLGVLTPLREAAADAE